MMHTIGRRPRAVMSLHGTITYSMVIRAASRRPLKEVFGLSGLFNYLSIICDKTLKKE
jgi:hypothetical protein